MNKIRDVVGTIFQSSMQQMSFPAYFAYVNGAGKVTARSIMEVQAAILTFLEEQETRNEIVDQQFKDAEELFRKMTMHIFPTTDKPLDIEAFVDPNDGFTCLECGKVCKSMFGLRGHMKSHKLE